VHYAYEWDEDIEVDLFNPKTQSLVKNEEPKTLKPEIKKEIELHDSMIIYYEVQIAAHTVPISAKYIKENIYNGNMKILERREEGWYKYTIGHFKNLDEADKLLIKVNVAKAFVVAYKNNRRVPIKETTEEFLHEQK